MPEGKILDPKPPSKLSSILEELELRQVKVQNPLKNCPVYYGVLGHANHRFLYFSNEEWDEGDEVDFDFAVFSIGYRIAVNVRARNVNAI